MLIDMWYSLSSQAGATESMLDRPLYRLRGGRESAEQLEEGPDLSLVGAPGRGGEWGGGGVRGQVSRNCMFLDLDQYCLAWSVLRNQAQRRGMEETG